MSMRQFIKEHRAMITLLSGGYATNDKEREQWVLNNERMYALACSKGVKV